MHSSFSQQTEDNQEVSQEKNTSMRKRPHAEINHQNINNQNANNAENSDKNEQPSNPCNMDKYLSNSQDKCASSLDNYEILKAPKALNKSQKKYIRDYSCDLSSVETSCYAIRQTYLFGKEHITADETRFPLAFAMKIHGFANQAHR